MSSESLAAFRKSYGDELANLAEQHLQHDLQPSDRDALKAAASSLDARAGRLLAGFALGGLLAVRLRANRTAMYRAFRTAEKPTHVRFADGREEALPDLAPLLKPTTVGDISTYTLFAAGGVFFGGELGLLSGSWSAKRAITRDPAVRERVERPERLRADMLRKQADDLDKGIGGKDMKEMFLS